MVPRQGVRGTRSPVWFFHVWFFSNPVDAPCCCCMCWLVVFVFCSEDYQLVGTTSSERIEELMCESGMPNITNIIWIPLACLSSWQLPSWCSGSIQSRGVFGGWQEKDAVKYSNHLLLGPYIELYLWRFNESVPTVEIELNLLLCKIRVCCSSTSYWPWCSFQSCIDL